MLEWRGMYRRPFTWLVLAALTSLWLIDTLPALAVTLRDEAYTYRAEGYDAQQRGDRATALALYQKAAQLDPTYAAPHNDIGILMEEQGRMEEAERAYQQALRIDPNYLEAHANLAMLYERLGNKELAIYHWLKRYQGGDPYDPWTVRAEERLAALGVLEKYPGLKGSLYTKRQIFNEEFDEHAKSIKDFRAVTEQHGNWP